MCVLQWTSAYAEEAVVFDESQSSVQPLPEILVTDTRLPSIQENILAVPVKLTVISAEDIQKSGAKTVQEALEKIPIVKKRSKQKPVFHFIGKLQRNKAKKAAELFDVIETVDSIKLGLALEKHCAALNKHIDALVQVNIGGENQKSGIEPERCEEIIQGLRNCKFLNIVGLMTMPPYVTDPEEVRPHFIQLRHLATELQAKNLLGQTGPVELSMGMSGDFEVAIEEGATLVRIGTALFGRRFR
jgi:hypothetical protein